MIYLPGLGDPRPKEKSVLRRLWGLYGIEVSYHPLYWNDNRPFEVKLKDIITEIDTLTETGTLVSLVGASAGASAAMNAFASRHETLNALVCICGKINNPQTVMEYTFSHNPSFRDSLSLIPHSLAQTQGPIRGRILSLHPLYDGVVPVADTFIEGAVNRSMPSVGHAASIAYADIFASATIARFLKTAAKDRS